MTVATPVSAALLDELEVAVVELETQPVSGADVLPARSVGSIVDDELAQRLSAADLVVLFDCAEHREAGLAATRAGNLEAARRQLAAVRGILRSARPSGDAELLATAMLEPAEAYLSYRLGRFAEARELLLHASALDRTLVRDRGYASMAAHRLQIAHNLLRIHCRLGEHEEATRLTAHFLDYLEFRVDCLPESLVCPPCHLDAIPDEVLEFFFDEMLGECAAFLAGHADARSRVLFAPLAGHASCGGGGFGSSGHAWLEVKALSLDGRVAEAVVAAVELIRLPALHASLSGPARDEALELRRRLTADGFR